MKPPFVSREIRVPLLVSLIKELWNGPKKKLEADFIGVKKKNPRVGKLSILTAA